MSSLQINQAVTLNSHRYEYRKVAIEITTECLGREVVEQTMCHLFLTTRIGTS